MRLTISTLGFTLLDISLTDGDEAATEFEPYQDAGTIASTVVDVGKVSGFEDRGSLHQFEPDEGTEDWRITGATGPIGFVRR